METTNMLGAFIILTTAFCWWSMGKLIITGAL